MKKQKNKQAKKASKLAKAENLKQKTITVKNAEGEPDTEAVVLVQNKIDYTPKVSVIIPVYNVEQYLRECLNSVIKQTLKEIEIICVDDGSTDNSLDILKEYAEKDHRITIITQKNLHAGVARNAGLAIAKGEYIHFLDSDDWVDVKVLIQLYELANNTQVDVLKFKNKTYDNKLHKIVSSSYTDITSFPDNLYDKKININSCLEVLKLPDCPWSGLYKLSYLKNNNILFDNLKCANDVSFFIEAISKGTVLVSRLSLVFYRINNAQSLVGIRDKNFICQIKLYNNIESRIKHLSVNIQREIKIRLLSAIGYRFNDYMQKAMPETKVELFNLAKSFFEITDISYVFKNYISPLYNISHVLSLREVLLRADNLEEYNCIQQDKQAMLQIAHYTSLNGISSNNITYTPKVSVIMPVYNTEQYLRECLNSVIKQTLKEIEIICVDDGSTDNSLSVLKEYAVKDKRITIITQHNLGAAVAKNRGLYLAQGEFVAFIDSDDLYANMHVLADLYYKAIQHNVNICGGGLKQFKGNLELINDPELDKNYVFADNTLISYSEYQYDFGFTRFIYNKKFLNQCKLYFPEYIRGEDPVFFVNIMNLAKQFYAIKQIVYYYRIGHKQLVWSDKMISNLLNSYADCLDVAIKYNNSVLYDRIISRLSSRDMINRQLTAIDSPQVFDAIKRVAQYKNIPEFYTSYVKTIKTKISVIIPVYNMEKYLRQCLDSVINQTLKDIEIICVNDGSTDKSLSILQEYAQNDNRICIINQQNQGLSCSRNNAMKIAKGRYILFLDSDDWIREDACQLLYERCYKYSIDMLHFAGINYDETTQQYIQLKAQQILYTNPDIPYYDKNALNKFIEYIPISACRFFYKRAFLEKHNILFPEKINFEDNYFVRKALIFAEKFAAEKEVLYFRRVHSSSITQNMSKFFADYITVVDKVSKLFTENNFNYEISKHIIINYCNSLYMTYLFFTKEEKNKYHQQLFDFLQKMQQKYHFNDKRYNTKYNLYKDLLSQWYMQTMHEPLDLDNPRTFNEKLQWLKIYNALPIKTRLADKYLVRDWVKEKIGEQYLIPLLGVYDKFEDIDFAKLPNQFVIKCNHGSGWNIIVTDKSKLDLNDAKTKLDKWLNTNFAFLCGYELHYRDIKPKIIIEKYMEELGTALYDYRFFCCDGKVQQIWVDVFSGTPQHKRKIYDTKWKELNFTVKWPRLESNIEKPKNLDKMISLAETMAEGFALVRVDFYDVNNHIYFGEMTFTSMSGTGKFSSSQAELELGSKIKLPKLAYDIDSGKYYKLPKKSRVLAWLALPFNFLRIKCLQHQFNKLQVKQIYKQLSSFRVDAKNFGTADNALAVIAPKTKVSTPAWFANEQGKGSMIEGAELKQSISLKAIKSGKLQLTFKGPDRRANNVRYPLWIDYKSIKIDGKEILSSPVATWHDKPFKYEMPVKDGQVVKIAFEQQPHQYAKSELKDVILKLNPNNNYIKTNIDKIVTKVATSIGYIPEMVLSQFPKIKADSFISLGAACRPAYWLQLKNLRQYALPFDWLMNYKLTDVISVLKNYNGKLFSQFNEDKNMIGKKYRYVKDTATGMVAMHAFPITTSVEKYLPEFNTVFNRRLVRFRTVCSNSENICFVSNRNYSLSDLITFGEQLHQLYQNLQIVYINVCNQKTKTEIKRYNINKYFTIYNIIADDVNERGATKEINPQFWLGNEYLWNSICNNFTLTGLQVTGNTVISPEEVERQKVLNLLQQSLAASQTLSKEISNLKGQIESLQKEVKTLKTEQVTTQKMLVNEQTLLQKRRKLN